MITRLKQNEIKEDIKAVRKKIDKVQIEMQEALSFGDLSENEEYHAAKRELDQLGAQLAVLEHKLETEEVVAEDAGLRIGMDSFIELTNLTNGREPVIVRLSNESDFLNEDPKRRTISYESPVGKVIFNCTSGDYEVPTKSGVITYRVRKLTMREVEALFGGKINV